MYVSSQSIILSINLWTNSFKDTQQLNIQQSRSKQKCNMLLNWDKASSWWFSLPAQGTPNASVGPRSVVASLQSSLLDPCPGSTPAGRGALEGTTGSKTQCQELLTVENSCKARKDTICTTEKVQSRFFKIYHQFAILSYIILKAGLPVGAGRPPCHAASPPSTSGHKHRGGLAPPIRLQASPVVCSCTMSARLSW